MIKKLKKFTEFNENLTNLNPDRIDIVCKKFKDCSQQDIIECDEAIQFLDKRFKTYDVNYKYLDYSVFINYYINNELIAVCEYCTHTDDGKKKMHISYIFSDDKRKGIASKLVQIIIDYYKDKNITCYVRASNIASLSMFKKLGFVIKKETDETIYNDEKGYKLELER